jgi:poly(beta-D-mannuronate) lyase
VAALATVPVGTALATSASAADIPVSSLTALQNAINSAKPGDRIVVADGTYTVPSGGLTVSGRHGTSSAPITIVAQSRGGVVLKGTRGFVLNNSSFITISGFAFRQSTTFELPENCSSIRLTRNDFQHADAGDPYWVVVRADDTKIDRNRFHDKTTTGIFLIIDGPAATDAMAQNVQVLRNHFSDQSYTGDNGGEPIRVGVSGRALSSAHAVVEYNLFERCNGDPEAVSVKSSDNTVRYNTIRDSVGGIVLRHGNRSLVESNHVLGGKNGIRVYGNDHKVVNNYVSGLSGRALTIGSGTTRDHHAGETETERRGNDACDRALIAHNSLIGNAKTLEGETRDYEPQKVVVADNLLVGDTGSLVAMGATTGFTWQSNLLWGAAANGNIPAGGFTRADPRLAKGADGVMRLTSASPAIGAATLAGTPVTDDIDGDPRGSVRDIGADEYATAAPLRHPLTASDVGPNAA